MSQDDIFDMDEEKIFDMSDEEIDNIFDPPDREPDPRAAAIGVATLKCLDRLEGELCTLSDQLDSLADYHAEQYDFPGVEGLILRLASQAAGLLCDQRIGDAIREAAGWPETEC